MNIRDIVQSAVKQYRCHTTMSGLDIINALHQDGIIDNRMYDDAVNKKSMRVILGSIPRYAIMNYRLLRKYSCGKVD